MRKSQIGVISGGWERGAYLREYGLIGGWGGDNLRASIELEVSLRARHWANCLALRMMLPA